MRSKLAVIISLLFLATPAFAQAQSSGNAQQEPLSSNDKEFLNFAAEDNHAEIESCLLAENKAVDLAVKAFTRLMVDDHVQIASRLASIVNQENYQPPNGIGEEGQKTMSELKGQSGNTFDQQFMQHQITDHEHDLQRFAEIQSQTQNARVRQFASETYPILQQHLALAKAVEKSLGQQNKRALR
jgi:putative membrane protein